MYKIKVNGQHDFEFVEKDGRTIYNGNAISLDYASIEAKSMHVLFKNKSYRLEITDQDKSLKSFTIKVNSKTYQVELADQYDELLHKLGLDVSSSSQISELKAPMPGLVLNVFVKEGDQVSKGDNIIILEAMKMENIIKSPVDGVIKNVKVQTGDKLEKNQVMVNFS